MLDNIGFTRQYGPNGWREDHVSVRKDGDYDVALNEALLDGWTIAKDEQNVTYLIKRVTT